MNLTSISIKNFKNIDENGITIPIAPITLLFGPNNAGKSTIIQALHLAREVFCAETPDFDKIKSYDKSVNIGKFVNYVHNHDITRTVSIKLEFETFPLMMERLMENRGFSIDENITANVSAMAIEFEIAWSTILKKPILAAYTIFINNHKLTKATITPSEDGKNAEVVMSPLSVEPFLSSEEYKDLIALVSSYTKHDLPKEYRKYVSCGFMGQFVDRVENLNKQLEAHGALHREALYDALPSPLSFFESHDELEKAIKTIAMSRELVGETPQNSSRDFDEYYYMNEAFFLEPRVDKLEKSSAKTYMYITKKLEQLVNSPFSLKTANALHKGLEIADLNPFYFMYITTLFLAKHPFALRDFCHHSSFFAQHNFDLNQFASVLDLDKAFEPHIYFTLENGLVPRWGKKSPIRLACLLSPNEDEATKTISETYPTQDSYPIHFSSTYFGAFVGSILNKMLYMGPIRDQIPRGPISPEKISDDKWAHGSAVWDLIATAEKEKLELLNSKILQLGLHYQINLKKLYALNESSTFKRKLESLLMGKDSLTSEDTEIVKEFLEQQTDVVIKLENTKTKIQTEIKDMGLGISQVLPILGATIFAPKNSFIAIEEPESHIHPKMQVNLGDIIIESALGSNNKPFFLIETHSEHLMLRLLRRIRETSEGELPDNFPKVSKDDISVNYIYSKQSGETTVKHLPITDDGDFATRWPHGFFDERDEELF